MDAWKFLKITIVHFEGTYFHFTLLQELLSECPLSLIILRSYIPGNKIWSSVNWLICNISII